MSLDWMAEGQLRAEDTHPWDAALTVTYIFERQGVDPSKLALVSPAGTRTYGELRSRSRRIAHGLVDIGVEAFERVAVLLPNDIEYIEIEGGIAGAQAIMVGLNWRLTERELLAIFDKARPRVVFGRAPHIQKVMRLREAGELPYVRHLVDVGGEGGDITYEALLDRGVDQPPPRRARMHEPHEIIFTSGTTGDPKGAVWTHGSLLWNAIQQVMDYRLSAKHSTYVMIDLYYIGGRHDLTYSLLYQGGTVHLKPSGGFDARSVVDYVDAHGITHILWVPAMLYEVLPEIESRGAGPESIWFIMSGGAPISRHMLEACMRLMPKAEIVQVYGLTEGGGSVTQLPAAYSHEKLGSCGRPSQNARIRVVRDDGSDCDPMEQGQVLVGGPSLSAGYWAMPDRTAGTLVDGWLHTGDAGYFDKEGFLYISGRKKDMIISGGMNIFPAEIEEVLVMHPAVTEAAVVGAPHEKWGEQVVAYVKRVPGSNLTEEDVAAHCRGLLAGFKKPQRVIFLEDFPRTASGKVKKHDLRARLGE